MRFHFISTLLSHSKWRKVWFILYEKILSAKYKLSLFTERFAVSSKAYFRGVPSDGRKACGISSDRFSDEADWFCLMEVPIKSQILEQVASDYKQDYTNKSNHVCVQHKYSFAVIPNASLYSNGATHVSIFDKNDKILTKYSYKKYRSTGQEEETSKRALPIDRHVAGKTLNLYGSVENTVGNYGHWLVDGIGMVFLATQKYCLEDIDYFLIPEIRHDFQLECMLELGIPKHKILEVSVLTCYQFESLICVSAPRGIDSNVVPGWLVDGYRNSIIRKKKNEIKRKLYVSRRDAKTRKFVNEEEVIDLLRKYDFKIVELSNYDFSSKVELFNSADVIIGLTGAGLTNLMFCRENAHVIEIFPENFVNYFYASIAGQLGLNYDCLIVRNNSFLNKISKYYGDLAIDISELEILLDNTVGLKCERVRIE